MAAQTAWGRDLSFFSKPASNEIENSHRSDWKWFIVASFLFSFGFALYNAVFWNYFQDRFHGQPIELGRLESLREVPGLLAALTASTLVALAETRVAAIGLMICGIGIGLAGQVNSLLLLTCTTVLWSIGFHLYSTVSSPITLTLAKGVNGGEELGKMGRVSSVAGILGLALTVAIAWTVLQKRYEVYFLLAGIFIFLSGLSFLLIGEHGRSGARLPLVFRREYGLFYGLTLLDGCRRMIFSIFALYVLIQVFHQSLATLVIVQFVNAAVVAMSAPFVGNWVDSIGERRMLIGYFSALTVIFVGYATTRSLAVLYGLYVLDNFTFNFNIATTTYLHKISRPGELTPNMAMGVTMNHVAAVSVPFLGALLWQTSANYRLPFYAGAAVALISVGLASRIPRHPSPSVPETTT